MKLAFDKEKFAKSLRQKRLIDEDVDLRVLAKKLKISASTLSRCENGRIPELMNYAKLCQWLNVPLQEFIKSK